MIVIAGLLGVLAAVALGWAVLPPRYRRLPWRRDRPDPPAMSRLWGLVTAVLLATAGVLVAVSHENTMVLAATRDAGRRLRAGEDVARGVMPTAADISRAVAAARPGGRLRVHYYQSSAADTELYEVSNRWGWFPACMVVSADTDTSFGTPPGGRPRVRVWINDGPCPHSESR